MNLYIYGSGGNGCELADIAERVNRQENRWSNICFVDDIREEKQWYGRTVLRFEAMLADSDEFECIISLGEPSHRKTLYKKLKEHQVAIATLFDPSANISPTAVIAEGCVVGPNSFISCNTSVGENTMLEVKATVGHDIVIGSHAVISSCSVVGAFTQIGDETFIGLSCAIKDRVNIGGSCIIGMGSCVFKDIDDGLIALGNPARPVKKNEDRKVFK